jgi:hypothetical protein
MLEDAVTESVTADVDSGTTTGERCGRPVMSVVLVAR